MVCVFVSLGAGWAVELDCKVFQFLHEDQAKQWMLNQLVLNGEAEPFSVDSVVKSGWLVNGEFYTDLDDVIAEFQNQLELSEYFHIYPLVSMVAQPTGRSSQLAL